MLLYVFRTFNNKYGIMIYAIFNVELNSYYYGCSGGYDCWGEYMGNALLINEKELPHILEHCNRISNKGMIVPIKVSEEIKIPLKKKPLENDPNMKKLFIGIFIVSIFILLWAAIFAYLYSKT